MARATQPVMINDIEFDALISESRTFEATVPEYSVEDGYSVSDAILLGAETLSMVLYVTNTPVTWSERHGTDQTRVNTVCKQLEDLYYSRETVTVTTYEASYTDMAIESLELTKSADEGYSREIPISFRKVRITKATTTTIPDSYGKSGASNASAGTASTKTGSTSGSSSSSSSSSSSDSSSSGSILYEAWTSVKDAKISIFDW